jgi:hypothetical protein
MSFTYDGSRYLGSYLLDFGIDSSLLDSLVSYWKLDGSSGAAADSAGSNTLTNTGVTYVSGKINNAGDFENSGTAQYLSISDASQSGLDITGDISVHAWLKPESAPGTDIQYQVVNKFLAAGDQRSYAFRYEDASGTKKLTMQVGTGASSENLSVNQNLGTGTFHDVVWTWKASNSTLTVYVDGSSIGTDVGSYTSLFSGTAPFIVGDSANLDVMNNFDGIIDEVGVWSRVLTSTEVSELYNSGSGRQYPF